MDWAGKCRLCCASRNAVRCPAWDTRRRVGGATMGWHCFSPARCTIARHCHFAHGFSNPNPPLATASHFARLLLASLFTYSHMCFGHSAVLTLFFAHAPHRKQLLAFARLNRFALISLRAHLASRSSRSTSHSSPSPPPPPPPYRISKTATTSSAARRSSRRRSWSRKT